MTYYELVSYLNKIVDTPIEYKNIEFLNSVSIKLDGERYERFINQMAILITDRITNMINNIREKLVTEYLDSNTLSIEMSIIKNEMKYCMDLCKCLLIKPKNQEEFIKSIIDTNNQLVNTLTSFFDDEERITIVKNLLIKEDII